MEVFREEVRSKFGRQCYKDALRLAGRPQGKVLPRQGELDTRSVTLKSLYLCSGLFLCVCMVCLFGLADEQLKQIVYKFRELSQWNVE